MISSVTSKSKYVVVDNGIAPSTYINTYSSTGNGSLGAGNIRYNPNLNSMEVCDGTNWIRMSVGHASVGLTSETESLLDWARNKRYEEAELARLAETNPTIASLVDDIKTKQEQIKMVQLLIKQEVKAA